MSIRWDRIAVWGLVTILFHGVSPDALSGTRTWTGGTSVDWFNAANWEGGQPTNGDTVYVTASARAPLLTASTPFLGSLVLTNQTLTCSNWSTTIQATNVTIATNGILMIPAAFQTGWMSNRISIVCSNFTLAQGGTIEVSDRGYAVSNGPGRGATGVFGAGGGHAGRGGYGFYGEAGGLVYDSMTAPTIPGSGAGRSSNGQSGSGGGVVRIQATNVTINGRINANGKSGVPNYSGGGAGGSIHITCRRFGGALTGLCSARGGGGHSGGGGGSGGMIAIHYQELDTPSLVRFETGRGGSSSYGGYPFDPGAYGTVWFPNTNLFCRYTLLQSYSGVRIKIPGLTSWQPSTLTVINGLVVFPDGCRLSVGGNLTATGGGTIVLASNSLLTVAKTALLDGGSLKSESNRLMTVDTLVLTNGATFQVYSSPTNHPATNYGMRVAVAKDLVIANNCWIYPVSDPNNGGSVQFKAKNVSVLGTNSGFNADAAGYANRTGTGKGGNGTLSSGGGYGGLGGINSPAYSPMPAGITYGNSNAPAMPGSGGGGDVASKGGCGGGLVWIEVSREVLLKGTLTANAGTTKGNYAGGGSGGGILISCERFIGTTTAVLRAEGGVGTIGGGGGGGGRIAVRAVTSQYAGRLSVTNGPPSSYSGTPSLPAEKGTIVFFKLSPGGTILVVK